MKFAFSTAVCPDWDFETIAVRAAEMKYQGVEIHGSFADSVESASNPFLTDPKKLAGLFAEAGVQIACLASSAEMTGDKRADVAAADECRRFIDLAAELGCGMVKVPDGVARAGQSRAAAGQALGDWLDLLGDYAAQRQVCIVVENALASRSAREMWAILDRISHPSIGCCWNLLNAAKIGESPYVSVPTLNSRINYAHITDARISPAGIDYCKLGEGQVPIEKFLTRLRGIGYEGWITAEFDVASKSKAEEILFDAIHKLVHWTQPKPHAHKHHAPFAVNK